jgi:hypothetical protein
MLCTALSVRAATAAATVLAVTATIATALPSTAHAAATHHASGASAGLPEPSSAKPKATIVDPRGDVVAKAGSPDDADSSADGFKSGKGTVVPVTDADNAIDLTEVTYLITRVGSQPVLKITYRARGPFNYTHHQSLKGENNSFIYDLDGLETVLGGGRYDLEASVDGGHIPDENGLFHNNDKHKQIACKGLHTKMKTGGHTAVQTVPLSCLTRLGPKGSKLHSQGIHIVVTYSATTTTTTTPAGSHSTTETTESARVATDSTHASWRLPFTS